MLIINLYITALHACMYAGAYAHVHKYVYVHMCVCIHVEVRGH